MTDTNYEKERKRKKLTRFLPFSFFSFKLYLEFLELEIPLSKFFQTAKIYYERKWKCFMGIVFYCST